MILNQKNVEVIKKGVRYNCNKIIVIKGGIKYNVWSKIINLVAFSKVTCNKNENGENKVYIAQKIDGSLIKGIKFYVEDAWANESWRLYNTKIVVKTTAGQEQILAEYGIGAENDSSYTTQKGKTLTISWNTNENVDVYMQVDIGGSGDAGAVLTNGTYIER